jgi:beta-lactamase regulating signal transducer with metallopeptidase domain
VSYPFLLELALHQLWQGAVLAACTWLGIRCFRRLSSETRYWTWWATLVLVAALPLLSQLPLPRPADASSPATVVAAPVTPELANADADVRVIAASSPSGSKWNWVPFALLALWTGVAGWRVLSLLRAARTLSEWRRNSTPVAPGDLPLDPTELGACEVRESARVPVPMVIGFARPCILLPRDLPSRMTRPQFALVLRHELAHARRGDTWLALLQRLVEAIYCYNPVVAWISRHVENERECSCDDRAIRTAGETDVEYADCLIHVTREAALARAPALAVGAGGRASQLRIRIERLLERSDREDTRMSLRYVLGSTLVLSALAALLSITSPRAIAENVDARPDNRNVVSHALGQALVEAAAHGKLDRARDLVSAGADVNYALEGDGTPLILAAGRGEMELVEFLVERGADIDKFSSGDGNPLIAASAAGHRGIVAALVERGADVNSWDAEDESPLINAARNGHLNVLDYLLDHGADINLAVEASTIKGTELRSPLSEARKHGHDAVVQRLLQRGAIR